MNDMPEQENGSDENSRAALDNRIGSVVLTFRVIDELALAGEPVGVSELARRIGEAKARVHRHLLTLRSLGVLAQARGSERYQLGWKLFQLGQAVASQSGIPVIAEPHMQLLRNATKLTVMLTMPAGDQMIVVHTVASEAPIAVTVQKGLRLPAHASDHGRLMLAFAAPDTADRILGQPIRKLTAAALTDPSEIRNRMERARREMFDTMEGETAYGVNSLAAPVLSHNKELVATVGLVGTHQQIRHPVDPGMVEAVRACAASISAALGSRSYPASKAAKRLR